MSENTAQLETVFEMIATLSPMDRIRLVEWVMSTLKQDLSGEPATQPKRSSYGVLADLSLDVSAEDIDEARREMWSNFPREDIA